MSSVKIDFSLRHSVETGSGSQPASHSVFTSALEADHLTSFNTEVKE